MFKYQLDQEISLSLPRPKIDAEPLFKLLDESRNELKTWLPRFSDVKDKTDEEKFLSTVMAHFGTGNSLNAMILYQDQPVGMISFNQFHLTKQSTEIGYWLGTKFVGKGIMHRAVLGMCDLGFRDYQVHKIEIHAAVENQRSNSVAKKAGFNFDGVLRDHELLPDGFHDENVWSLLKSEWQQQRKTTTSY